MILVILFYLMILQRIIFISKYLIITIEILKKENRIISGKLQEVSDSMELEIPNRKPPHY